MPVSVIISVYNRCKFVAKSVESVLSQSYEDFELIIVDDASTDGTSTVLRDLAQSDARITLVHQPENRGGPTGRNLALSLTRYDLVACMDDDDIMLPHRLRVQVEFMEAHPEVSVLSSAAYMIDSDDKVIGLSIPELDLERGLTDCEPGFFVNLIHPATMYRKNDVLRVGAYRDLLLDDRDLWGRLATSGYKLAVSPEPVLLHRRHSSIMTTRIHSIFEVGDYVDHNIIRRLQGNIEITFDEYRHRMSSRPFWQRFLHWNRRKAAVSFRLATLHYSNKDWIRFLIHLSTAIALSPSAYIKRIVVKRARIRKRYTAFTPVQKFQNHAL